MTSINKDPILVVVQLTGGNDYINTVIPYQDPLYYDSRKTVGISQDEVLPISDGLAFNPALTAMKSLYDQGKVAVINGIGYPCLLYTSPSPRDATLSRMPSSA